MEMSSHVPWLEWRTGRPHSLGLIQINHVHVAWPVHCIRDVKTDITKLIAISKYAHSRGYLFRPFDTPGLNSIAYSKY